jgi:NAD(P)-dependent dehydrogenase (short-subunit alcohol dehydrogenase family)
MNRPGRVEGKVALVTGAGGGIGAACALALAREGAAVALADIDLAAAERQASVITAEGGRAVRIAGGPGPTMAFGDRDGRVHGRATRRPRHPAQQRRRHRLSATRDMPVEKTETEVWDTILRTNLRGTMIASRAAVAH